MNDNYNNMNSVYESPNAMPKINELVFSPGLTNNNLIPVLFELLDKLKQRREPLYQNVPPQVPPVVPPPPPLPETIDISDMINTYNNLVDAYNNTYLVVDGLNNAYNQLIDNLGDIPDDMNIIREGLHGLLNKLPLDDTMLPRDDLDRTREYFDGKNRELINRTRDLVNLGNWLNEHINDVMDEDVDIPLEGGGLKDVNRKMAEIQNKLNTMMKGSVLTFPNISQPQFKTIQDLIDGINKLKTELEKSLGQERDLKYKNPKPPIEPIDLKDINLNTIKKMAGIDYSNVQEMLYRADELTKIFNDKARDFEAKTNQMVGLINQVEKKILVLEKIKNIDYKPENFTFKKGKTTMAKIKAYIKQIDELNKKKHELEMLNQLYITHDKKINDFLGTMETQEIDVNSYKTMDRDIREKQKGNTDELDRIISFMKDKKLRGSPVGKLPETYNRIYGNGDEANIRKYLTDMNSDIGKDIDIIGVQINISGPNIIIIKEFAKNRKALKKLSDYSSDADIKSIYDTFERITEKYKFDPQIKIFTKVNSEIENLESKIEEISKQKQEEEAKLQASTIKININKTNFAENIKVLNESYTKINRQMTQIVTIINHPFEIVSINEIKDTIPKEWTKQFGGVNGTFESFKTNISNVNKLELLIQSLELLVAKIDQFKYNVNRLFDGYYKMISQYRANILYYYYQLMVLDSFKDHIPHSDIDMDELDLLQNKLMTFLSDARYSTLRVVHERLTYLVKYLLANKDVYIELDSEKSSFMDLLMIIYFIDTF